MLQTSKDALEADNERLSALSDNKDVSSNLFFLGLFLSVILSTLPVCKLVRLSMFLSIFRSCNISSNINNFSPQNYTQVTIKILQDEISALEKAQAEFMDMMERQRIQDELERQRRREEDKLMLMQERKLLLQQRQDLQAEVCFLSSLLFCLSMPFYC